MLRMRQLLSRILFAQVQQRNPAYSVLFVIVGCGMAWNSFTNLTNFYGRVHSTEVIVLGLALLAVGLQMFIQAVVYALPDRRRQTKLGLAAVVLSLASVALILLIVSLVVRFSAS